MAVASVVLYQGEGGWSVEDVNRLSDSFSKMRQWRSHDGVDLTDLFVITESDPSLFYRGYYLMPYDMFTKDFIKLMLINEKKLMKKH